MAEHQHSQAQMVMAECQHSQCYECTSRTIISFTLSPLSPFPLALWPPSFTSCNGLELDYLLIPRLGQDALWTVPLLLPLSITSLTLTFTVPSTCASVPVDVHPLCPLCIHISSLLPYVPLHLCARYHAS